MASKLEKILSSVNYAEALDVALCYGWIDGQKGSFDEQYFLQKFTPRRPKSIWSKINVEKAEQFIASGEAKWKRASGLVMFLPHGYEGQGPEHSSARLERFLQLCAEDNMQVCNITTPAQYFHVLRRQIHRGYRKPLIIMSPKSLLRSEDAASRVEDFTNARFEEILDDPTIKDPKKVNRVVFCSGKVYYDLVRGREEAKQTATTVIIRFEQIYPLHSERLKALAKRYPGTKRYVWCQEEPQNMGAWNFIAPRIAGLVGSLIGYAGREESASTATGSSGKHKEQQAALIKQAFEV